ncbi:MAG TPA: hypothetical protein VM030_03985 [Acidimicrobiales bacterium]|nr:hypothetical protein [Acidimicrobiales bacterium]
MRRVMVLLVVGALGAATPPAGAEVEVEGDGDGVITRAGRRITSPASTPAAARRGSRPAAPVAPPPGRIVRAELRWDDDLAQSCVKLGERPGDPNSRAAQDAEQRAQWLVGRFPICPGSDGTRRPSAATVAILMWQQRTPLPTPVAVIRPGRAITGREAFLEIGGAPTGHWHFEVFGYSIDIDAASTYDVDWGDGTATTGLTSRGGPWPDGDIRHVWTRTCACDVVVTQRWRGTWTAGGGRLPIPGVMVTRSTIDDFPVRQIQAVRER